MGTSVALAEPLIQVKTSCNARCEGKTLARLSLIIGLGFAVLLILLPWARSSDGQHFVVQEPAITMASTIPRHQALFGKKAFSWQSHPLPSCQPSWSKQKPQTVQVSAETWNPPPYSDTLNKFYSLHSPLINPMFVPLLSDNLCKVHFIVNSKQFKYDALFALGLRETFTAMFDTYERIEGAGKGEKLFSAFCSAMNLQSEQLIKDAETLTSYARSTSPEDILKHMEGTEKASDTVVASTFESKEIPRSAAELRGIGLFKLMEFTGVELNKAKAEEWAKAAKIDPTKFLQNLEAWRTTLRKVQAAEEMLNDAKKRGKRDKEKPASEVKEKAEQEAAKDG